MRRLVFGFVVAMGCGSPRPADPVPAPVTVEPSTPEPAPIAKVLFVVNGTHLIPAICWHQGAMESGSACNAHLASDITVRLGTATAKARRSRFVCGPTDEVTMIYELSSPTNALFAVAPPDEPTARRDVQEVSARIAKDREDTALFSLDATETIPSLATSDLDGDGTREGIVLNDYGHGRIYAVARFGAGQPSEVLFVWECGS